MGVVTAVAELLLLVVVVVLVVVVALADDADTDDAAPVISMDDAVQDVEETGLSLELAVVSEFGVAVAPVPLPTGCDVGVSWVVDRV